jgi:hypothetical protein
MTSTDITPQTHHPVVTQHAAQRAADPQLRIADAITAFAAMLLRARQSSFSVFDLDIFKDVNFAVGAFYHFMISGLLFVAVVFLPALGEGPLGYSATLSGLTIVPRAVLMMLVMLCVGEIIGKIGYRLLRWSPTSGYSYLPVTNSKILAPANSYSDTSVLADQIYCYELLPFGSSNNTLGQSDLLCIYPHSASGTDAPGLFTIRLDQSSVAKLSWSLLRQAMDSTSRRCVEHSAHTSSRLCLAIADSAHPRRECRCR